MSEWCPGLNSIGSSGIRYPRPAGTARQRRLTLTRRRQAQRRWWRDEGLRLAQEMIRSGQGGGIFGVVVVFGGES